MKQRCASVLIGGIAGLSLLFGAAPASAQRSDDDPFFLGVQTHFVQGWRLEFLQLLPELGATVLRDELSWPTIEATPGHFDFNGDRAAYMRRALDMGLEPLLLFTDTNPLYDDGQTPYSAEGLDALAAYVVQTLDAFGPGLRRIEIGNEFNSDDFVSGPFADNRPRHFSAMLRAVHKAVKTSHPETEILCTGTHSVAMGFFRSLFENGILEYCDALSLHLYRDRPEQVDAELDRLRTLMAEFGRVLPIYVTEFGQWFDDAEAAPDFMLKIVAQMGASGVAGAWWYALLDQPWWPNMGLYLPDNREPMPAADSFRLLQERLLPLGRPRRIGDSASDHIYAFGQPAGAVIAWGAPGRLVVAGADAFLDSRGNPVSPVTELGEAAIVILGDDLSVHVERNRQLVDIQYSFGQPPWSYHALRPDGRLSDLQYIDWEWASFLGDPWLRPLLVSQEWISGAKFDNGPHHAIERFTAPASGEYQLEARWFAPDSPQGDGADIRISHNGIVLAEGLVTSEDFTFGPQELSLAAGDQINFAVGPNQQHGGDALRREIVILYPRP